MDLLPKEYKSSGINSGLTGETGLANASPDPLKKWPVLLLVLVLLAGLLWSALFLYRLNLSKRVSALKEDVADLNKQRDGALEQRLISFEKGLLIFKGLLKEHLYSSEILGVLEKATLPTVQWKGLKLETENQTLDLDGVTKDYSTVAKQILTLEEGGLMVLSVSDISFDKEKGVGFKLRADFPAEVVKK